MIMGLLPPTSGRVLVRGVDVWEEPVAAKLGVGYVPDRPACLVAVSGPDWPGIERLDLVAAGDALDADHALVAGLVREPGRADHIADRVDPGLVGAQPLVVPVQHRRRVAGEEPRDECDGRHQIHHGQSAYSAEQQQRVVPKLRIGAARDHPRMRRSHAQEAYASAAGAWIRDDPSPGHRRALPLDVPALR
jgi:hypothetical protein